MQQPKSKESGPGLLSDFGSEFGIVLVGTGILSMVLLGILMAVWIWAWVDSLLTAPLLVKAGLTFVGWLIATTVVPGIMALFGITAGSVIPASVILALGGGLLVWHFTGVVWQAVVAGYALGFGVWYGSK